MLGDCQFLANEIIRPSAEIKPSSDDPIEEKLTVTWHLWLYAYTIQTYIYICVYVCVRVLMCVCVCVCVENKRKKWEREREREREREESEKKRKRCFHAFNSVFVKGMNSLLPVLSNHRILFWIIYFLRKSHNSVLIVNHIYGTL